MSNNDVIRLKLKCEAIADQEITPEIITKLYGEIADCWNITPRTAVRKWDENITSLVNGLETDYSQIKRCIKRAVKAGTTMFRIGPMAFDLCGFDAIFAIFSNAFKKEFSDDREYILNQVISMLKLFPIKERNFAILRMIRMPLLIEPIDMVVWERFMQLVSKEYKEKFYELLCDTALKYDSDIDVMKALMILDTMGVTMSLNAGMHVIGIYNYDFNSIFKNDDDLFVFGMKVIHQSMAKDPSVYTEMLKNKSEICKRLYDCNQPEMAAVFNASLFAEEVAFEAS